MMNIINQKIFNYEKTIILTESELHILKNIKIKIA